jgi:hypothetical protein
MKKLMLGLSLALLLSASTPAVTEAAGGFSVGLEPTSPAGYADDTPSSSVPQWLIHRARSFRGNPVPLGVLTAAILVVALAFGIYTVAGAYRQPEPSRHA